MELIYKINYILRIRIYFTAKIMSLVTRVLDTSAGTHLINRWYVTLSWKDRIWTIYDPGLTTAGRQELEVLIIFFLHV